MTAVHPSWSFRSSGFAKTPLNATRDSRRWFFSPATGRSISTTLARGNGRREDSCVEPRLDIQIRAEPRARQGGELPEPSAVEPGAVEPGAVEPGAGEPEPDDFELHSFE